MIKALKKNVMKLNGQSNTFGYLPFSARQKEKVANTFTLETVFSMNQTVDKVFCKIQRAHGIDLSLQEVDMLNYGLTLVAYKRVGVQLEANKTYHLTGTYNGSEVAIYVDGKSK